MPGNCDCTWSTAFVTSTATGLTSKLDGMNSVSSSWDHRVEASVFTSEENKSLREASDFPKVTGSVLGWGQDWSSMPGPLSLLLSCPMGMVGLRESLRLIQAAALHCQGQCEVLREVGIFLAFPSRESRCRNPFLFLHIFWAKNDRNVAFSAPKSAKNYLVTHLHIFRRNKNVCKTKVIIWGL